MVLERRMGEDNKEHHVAALSLPKISRDSKEENSAACRWLVVHSMYV